ncbi:MAG TPA: DUF169 domain-containing protein [Actinomycetota bacterium]|nr:DUF169 domain-containing protein [Actinomycetota bacterium]
MSWTERSAALSELLGLSTPPIAITFTEAAPDGVGFFDAPMAEATPDGRTGRVPAGCVFWMEAAKGPFATAPADHGNCSVGSLTHGLITLEEAAGRADVGAIVEAGWVDPSDFADIPTVSRKPGAITYAPLDRTPLDPDVVLVRVNGKQMMVLHDAVPDMYLGGKPQCHIVAIAAEEGRVAGSVGCALSRVRTAMPATEMTCAIPASQLDALLESLRENRAADDAVATYAAEDKRRFARA